MYYIFATHHLIIVLFSSLNKHRSNIRLICVRNLLITITMTMWQWRYIKLFYCTLPVHYV